MTNNTSLSNTSLRSNSGFSRIASVGGRYRTFLWALLNAIVLVGMAYGGKSYFDNRPVVFDDPVLEEEISTCMGISGRPITRKEAKNVRYLDLAHVGDDGGKIRSLAGISYFGNLEELYLSDQMISDVSELRKLRNLRNLHLGGNQICDVSALASLTNLKSLDLKHFDTNISIFGATRSGTLHRWKTW